MGLCVVLLLRNPFLPKASKTDRLVSAISLILVGITVFHLGAVYDAVYPFRDI